jgi:AbrB family looped-hinge helix DNA binding protein
MARVTSKLQVTIPKAVADRYGIRPGDEIEWVPAGEGIRVMPAARPSERDGIEWRLELFDRASERQRARDAGRAAEEPGERGWSRAELYERARPR